MNLSIIIPAYNESESIDILVNEINSALNSSHLLYEIIIIDDGSDDGTWDIVKAIQNKHVKGIQLMQNMGKSVALDAGFKYSIGEVIITMDADLQDDPNEIISLYKMINDDGFDMVSGWKKRRLDPLSKTIPTKLYNWTTRIVSGIPLNDFNCGLKSYSNKLVKSIDLSGEMHRYIPLIAHHAGYKKIGEKIVNHRKRSFGKTKYGLSRFSNGLLDLISISFLNKFGKSPMHFFGFLGLFFFLIGFVIAIYLTYTKLFLFQSNMTDRPLFYLGILCMLIGTQLFLAGFIGELILKNNSKADLKKINEKIGF
ncbi:MAG: glycosyltransferase [Flavobacteriales bacterium]|nr:glycosyltransferase [Flavobacteriales bacterium]|tara:strand:- start:18556 stop:19488 length:933 start_codon:yes stop_codon:yes gene_type:complete